MPEQFTAHTLGHSSRHPDHGSCIVPFCSVSRPSPTARGLQHGGRKARGETGKTGNRYCFIGCGRLVYQRHAACGHFSSVRPQPVPTTRRRGRRAREHEAGMHTSNSAQGEPPEPNHGGGDPRTQGFDPPVAALYARRLALSPPHGRRWDPIGAIRQGVL